MDDKLSKRNAFSPKYPPCMFIYKKLHTNVNADISIRREYFEEKNKKVSDPKIRCNFTASHSLLIVYLFARLAVWLWAG